MTGSELYDLAMLAERPPYEFVPGMGYRVCLRRLTPKKRKDGNRYA